MKKIYLLSSLLFFYNSLISSLSANDNTANFDSLNGYNNCNFRTNGENFWLKRFLKKKTKIILDVGANVGNWTKIANLYAPQAKVYSFEPHHKTFEILAKNFISKSNTVYPVNIAISDSEESKPFFTWADEANPDQSELNSFFIRPILYESTSSTPLAVETKVTTLDKFCNQNMISNIDYLKIDTEGNEYFVLKGAEQLLKEKKVQIIQFEYGGTYLDSNTTLKQVFELLKKYEFDIYRILPQSLLLLDSWQEEFENYQYSNYIAILNDTNILFY
jgi:FkbM family methyltransferase